MKINKSDAFSAIGVLIGVVINANILTLIVTFGWTILMDIVDIVYPGYFEVQALCLCALSLTVQPLAKTVYEQMWQRFYFSSSIGVYIFVLWVTNLI